MVDKNKFLIALSESEQTSFGRVDFAEQSEEQQVFSAVYGMKGQVNNGGFDQAFFEYPDDLTELFFTFVRAHPEAFGAVTQE
jgi:hypothetical protein